MGSWGLVTPSLAPPPLAAGALSPPVSPLRDETNNTTTVKIPPTRLEQEVNGDHIKLETWSVGKYMVIAGDGMRRTGGHTERKISVQLMA